MNAYNPYLSKSLYVKGCQCHKALWLKKYRPELADPISPSQQALFDSGTDVGILAQELFPGGVLIPYDGLTMNEQVTQTAEAIGRGEKTNYEASFTFNDIFFKADIMNLTSEGWNLYEVKASTSVKDVYLEDVAVQRHVLAGAGICLNRAHVIHINNQYIRRGGLDIHQLFSIVDVTEQTEPLLAEVPVRIADLRQMLQEEMPAIDIGPHCGAPYACDFSGHCWQHVPHPSVFNIARIGKKGFDLYYQGFLRLEDVPSGSLNAKQRLQQSAWVEKSETLRAEKIGQFLDSLVYPLSFMDFETFSSPVPHFDNNRPYCQVPFQYSLHIQDNASAGLVHREFLADGKSDPQQSFLESLLADIPASGSIVVWNQAFEKGRLQELQKLFPRKWQPIQNMLDRVVDLMVPFRDQDLYHWKFQGSYSIKKVLPVLAPELTYETLVIQNGEMAPAEWFRMIQLDDEAERQVITEQLLAYCGLDTYAMVRILEELQKKLLQQPFIDHLAAFRSAGTKSIT